VPLLPFLLIGLMRGTLFAALLLDFRRGNPAAHSPGRPPLQLPSKQLLETVFSGQFPPTSSGCIWWNIPSRGAVAIGLCHRGNGRSPAERIPRTHAQRVLIPYGTQPHHRWYAGGARTFRAADHRLFVEEAFRTIISAGGSSAPMMTRRHRPSRKFFPAFWPSCLRCLLSSSSHPPTKA